MAGYLQKLLNAKEPMFSFSLRSLEKATGNHAIDVKLIGDIHNKAQRAMRQIGLDPADTTAEELYSALQSCSDHAKVFKRTAYVGVLTKSGIVSLNHQDVVDSKGRTLSKRVKTAMRLALAQELVNRYKATGRISEQRIVELLKDASVEFEKDNKTEKEIK